MSQLISNQTIARYFGIGSTIDPQTGTVNLNLNGLVDSEGNPLLAKLFEGESIPNPVTFNYFDETTSEAYLTVSLGNNINSDNFYYQQFKLSSDVNTSYNLSTYFLLDTNTQNISDYVDLETNLEVTTIEPSNTQPNINKNSDTYEGNGQTFYLYKQDSYVFGIDAGVDYLVTVLCNKPANLGIDVFIPEIDLGEGGI